MKKIIALLLSIVIICCVSVTAFAAKSPVADEKATVTVKKATGTVSMVSSNAAGATKEYAVDVEYTFEVGSVVTLKADEKYGTFNDWKFYKEVVVEETDSATGEVVKKTKMVEAVEGEDYVFVKGNAETEETEVKLISSVVICANYDDVVTDPEAPSNVDTSDSAPQTGDMMAVYAVVIMLAAAVFGLGVKKVYSK